MVDFKNDSLVTVSHTRIVNIGILEKRENLYISWEKYKASEFNKVNDTKSYVEVKSRLFTLFTNIYAMLKRVLSEQEFIRLCKLVKSENMNELLMATLIIEEFLDKIELTKIDKSKEELDKHIREG